MEIYTLLIQVSNVRCTITNNMILVAKQRHNPKQFWVEDYNDRDKSFFESLGFKEVPAKGPKVFGFKDTLEFKGSNVYGLWTKEESERICIAFKKYYGSEPLDDIEIMDPNR
jgi:hypothetical protein